MVVDLRAAQSNSWEGSTATPWLRCVFRMALARADGSGFSGRRLEDGADAHRGVDERLHGCITRCVRLVAGFLLVFVLQMLTSSVERPRERVIYPASHDRVGMEGGCLFSTVVFVEGHTAVASHSCCSR